MLINEIAATRKKFFFWPTFLYYKINVATDELLMKILSHAEILSKVNAEKCFTDSVYTHIKSLSAHPSHHKHQHY